MKPRHLMLIFLLFFLVGFASAEAFTPNEGTFAFREVDIMEINGINFTVPTDFNITFQNDTAVELKNPTDKLKISVSENGKVKHVKEDRSKNITASKTMLGSVEGYLVEKNGSYAFSYKEDSKLVVIKSKNLPLIMGVMDKD